VEKENLNLLRHSQGDPPFFIFQPEALPEQVQIKASAVFIVGVAYVVTERWTTSCYLAMFTHLPLLTLLDKTTLKSGRKYTADG
jgi:hypothetical protein